MTRSKDIGTWTETATVRYLRNNGFPHAERRAPHGSTDLGDVTGTPGVAWEVKGGKAAEQASDGQIEKWLKETEVERRNADADYGILIVKRKGIGEASAGRWWAILPAHQFLRLNREKGRHHAPDLVRCIPVRIHLQDAVKLLRIRGYGSPLDEPV